MPPAKPTVAGLFAGVGGVELGFQQAGFRPVLANEIDPKAAETYRRNHSHRLIEGDISGLESSEFPEDLAVLTAGFPCQPFSIAGYRQGFDDARGNVYWDVERIVRDISPEVVFLENVKNLLTHDGGNTFRVIRESLESLGYSVDASVLNSTEYGNIPQNRERIYIVAFRDFEAMMRFEWPEKQKLTSSFKDFLEPHVTDPSFFYDDERPFYDKLSQSIKSSETLYQWRRQYVRENKSGVCPTLTANMGTGGHNVPLVLTDSGVRKLTPRECFNLMGFPSDFALPEGMARSHLYKQAGNAVVVPVIKSLAEQIKAAVGSKSRGTSQTLRAISA